MQITLKTVAIAAIVLAAALLAPVVMPRTYEDQFAISAGEQVKILDDTFLSHTVRLTLAFSTDLGDNQSLQVIEVLSSGETSILTEVHFTPRTNQMTVSGALYLQFNSTGGEIRGNYVLYETIGPVGVDLLSFLLLTFIIFRKSQH